MAEPIRKPVHRPRPPHPHTQQRPHDVLVRSRLLPPEREADAETVLPRPAPARPALVRTPVRTAQPAPPVPEPVEHPVPPLAVLAPPEETLTERRIPEARSSRSLLLTALALHLGVVLTAWFGQPAPDLDPADLLLSGAVLLSGGTMLVLGGVRRPHP